MDITPSITTTTNNTASTKSPEADSETPTRIQQPLKPLSFSNGVLKRHNPTHHLHHQNIPITPVVVTYKECLKNHAAALGGHALDGCGEFMPSPAANLADPTSLKCAACGCHRNFHRRDPEDPVQPNTPAATTHVIEYQPHHRHHPPPPTHPGNRSPSSASPPPISSSYYPSAPHMLLALSTAHENALAGANNNNAVAMPQVMSRSPNARKRFRTKFTQDQKEKMYQFAERVGWKMQKRDEEIVREFCNEAGVEKGVLKVWMHNNKNTFSKRDVLNGGAGGRAGSLSRPSFLLEHSHHHNNGTNGNGTNGNGNNNDDDEEEDDDQNDNKNGVPNPNHHYQGADGGGNNGSSSSS
ncbi:hypothetical protein ACFX15_044334 [Malus domestica]|uniref:zinc-finger homeodomain protein 9-like n=1 Tax=Malus domestica TaxID=3750 RepID=UPI000498C5B8|nr:zinc-finger homeodomain protein 9-like [Malus domestica]